MDFPPENIKDRLAKFLTGERKRDDIIVKVFIGIVLIVSAVFMFPHTELMENNYNIGAIWVDKDLVSPFAFPIYKDLRRYELERQEAIRSVPYVFERHDDILQNEIDSIKIILKSLQEAVETHTRLVRSNQKTDSLLFDKITGSLQFILTDDEWNMLFKSQDAGRKKQTTLIQKFNQSLPSLLAEVLHAGVIDRVKAKQLHSHLALRKGREEEVIPYEKIYDEEDAAGVLSSHVVSLYGDNSQSAIAIKITKAILRPNVIFNRGETSQALQIAADNVPRTIGYVQSGERIIGKHDRITEEVKLKLDSYNRAKVERGATYNQWQHLIGTFLQVVIILGLFALYLHLFRKNIFRDNGKLMLITLLIIMEMLFAYLSLQLDLQVPLQYLILVPTASMLLAIIFDSRVAFYGTVTIAFLISGMRGNDYAIALSSIVAGALGAYTVRDIRSRTQIFRSLIFIFLGYSISIIALSFQQLETFPTIFTELTFAMANAVFSPVLTYGLLIFFERAFEVTTDLTLLELSDLNHPLLMELSEKAPGTFHHSVIIGNLAEAAAEAIDANTILARVGGYYHDIGKLLKPEYYVENQVGPHSRHTRLKPRMSALIIASHVKEGIVLGKEKGLPEKLLDFILQHHGTTRISFFFDKALKQATKKPSKDAIHEEDFLYPGPKPQTKETGIVMLADSVEATTRALQDITPQKLEAAIDNMIKHRFMEGQLDECELTLRELTKIREAFLKILTGTYHQRIKYPEQQPEVVAVPPEPEEQYQQQSIVTIASNQETNEKQLLPDSIHLATDSDIQPQSGNESTDNASQHPNQVT